MHREIPLNDELFELLIKQKEKAKDRFVVDKDGIRNYDREPYERILETGKESEDKECEHTHITPNLRKLHDNERSRFCNSKRAFWSS